MKNAGRLSGTTAVIIMLVAMIIFCTSGTLLCLDTKLNRTEELGYRILEREYESELRVLLEEKGYSNSGVTMNSIVQEDGVRSYTVTIHHKKIEALDNVEKRALAAECQGIEASVENCSVYFQ